MPRIFDNIGLPLLPILQETLKVSCRADFCVGYFNLRGWQKIDDLIAQYVDGESSCCRLLTGMQSLPSDEVHAAFTLGSGDRRIDNSAILRFKNGWQQNSASSLLSVCPPIRTRINYC